MPSPLADPSPTGIPEWVQEYTLRFTRELNLGGCTIPRRESQAREPVTGLSDWFLRLLPSFTIEVRMGPDDYVHPAYYLAAHRTMLRGHLYGIGYCMDRREVLVESAFIVSRTYWAFHQEFLPPSLRYDHLFASEKAAKQREQP